MVALFAVVGAGLGLVLATVATPVYSSQVTFLASTPDSETGNALTGDDFAQQRVNTYVKLLGSQALAERVVASSGTKESVDTVMENITGSAQVNTVLFTASASDSSPRGARDLAGAVATQLPMLVNGIETQDGTQRASARLRVVSGPSVSEFTGASKKLDLAVGLLLGAFLGLGLVLLLALRDRSVREPDAVASAAGAPYLGAVPHDPEAGRSPVPSGASAGGSRAEAYRFLRTNLRFLDGEKTVGVLAVASPGRGEGRSSTAVNVAASFAEIGHRVVVVDGDLRAPGVARLLGLESGDGLSDVLLGRATVDDVLRASDVPGLSVLPSGPVPEHPVELLDSRAMDALLADLRSRFDLVVVDTAPGLSSADAAVVSARADGTLLLARHGRTRDESLTRLAGSLAAIKARVLGVVITRVP